MKRIASWQSANNNIATENCRIHKTDDGFIIESVVNGILNDTPTYCAYKIRTNQNWETQEFTVYTWIGWEEKTVYMKKDASGNWENEGRDTTEFKDCIDIDISTTPFTNTLPIRRLQLEIGASKVISVVYINAAKQTVEPCRQIYTRLSPNTYRYQDAHNNFSAELTVDDEGLVIDYPKLWRRL